MTEQITEIGRTIEALGASRGFPSLEDVAAVLNTSLGQDYTTEELADWPRGLRQ